MISSTYTDLQELRRVLIEAAQAADLFPNAMEHSAALPIEASLWWQGRSPQEALDTAEPLARSAKGRHIIRGILNLRGEWRLAAGDARAAIAAFDESAQLARASGRPDLYVETWLALAGQQAGQLGPARGVVVRYNTTARSRSPWPFDPSA